MRTQDGVAAFFDLDHTVLADSSSMLWARYQRREGKMSSRQMASLVWWTLGYKLAVIDMPAIVRRLALDMRGQSKSALIAESDRWFEEMVRPRIAPLARQRIDWHLAEGHTVALLTASTAYVSAPVARDLGLDRNYICTRLEIENDIFTGRCVEPICYGPGKVHWAQLFAAERGLDIEKSYFYSDSYTDLAVLEVAGHPVVVNPDARLRRHADRRGWPQERFF